VITFLRYHIDESQTSTGGPFLAHAIHLSSGWLDLSHKSHKVIKQKRKFLPPPPLRDVRF